MMTFYLEHDGCQKYKSPGEEIKADNGLKSLQQNDES